jgi:acetate kinase
MKILVVNCGSSSIKYKLYRFPQNLLIAKGLIEKIGENSSSIANHSQGIKELFSRLLKEKVITDTGEIAAIGHRVVHGAQIFRKPHLIDGEVLKKIEECSRLAPLHNPANLSGIMGCKEALPGVPQIAVFDTAFHQTIPAAVYHYAIPTIYYEKYGVRRYGFHGTSHQFVAQQAAKLLKKPFNSLKLITCHLGNGCSITAINKGKVVDTSMGFTPLEGLMMGTRSGNIDVAAVFYIMEKEGLSLKEMDEVLNRKSGLLGVSGISNDVRDIKKEIRKGNKLAKLALEMFIYRIQQYIGAYYFVLGGADAICFTAGIGENNPDIINRFRKNIFKTFSRRTKVLIIPTDEELMIAELTYNLLKNTNQL